MMDDILDNSDEVRKRLEKPEELMEARKITAERICGLLLFKAMSYESLARATNLTVEAVRRYAIGERQPRGPILLSIANALNTTIDFLLGRTDDPDWRPDYAAMDIDELIRTSVPMSREDKQKLAEIIFGKENFCGGEK